MSGFVYLSSPYTHPDKEVRQKRFEAACRASARMMDEGHVVFSPIAHSHSIETLGFHNVRDGKFWMNQDIPLLRHASLLVVLKLDGWMESKGIEWEVRLAESIHIPIIYMEPA